MVAVPCGPEPEICSFFTFAARRHKGASYLCTLGTLKHGDGIRPSLAG